MKPKLTNMKTLAIASGFAVLMLGNVFATPVQAADTARYEVRFDVTWTAASHPLDYPAGAHFSGLIGATHGHDYHVFNDGGTATPGLEALSERGAHSPLNQEIKSAINAGKAGAFFESSPLFEFPGSISATFEADTAHPYVSAVAMIAPSPDWFTGVSNISLRKDGKWVEKATYTLFAWDAGTDSGTTHEADDADTMPRQSVRLNAAPQFKGEKGLKPVGTVTFMRMRKTAHSSGN
jgi:hypothetical protein